MKQATLIVPYEDDTDYLGGVIGDVLSHTQATLTVIPVPVYRMGVSFEKAGFLVPHLCGYQGQAVYAPNCLPNDMDISDLLERCPPFGSVYVCPESHKALKIMVFNCAHGDCRQLRPGTVAAMSEEDLEQMRWTRPENIGIIDFGNGRET